MGYDQIIILIVSPYTVGNHAYLFGCDRTDLVLHDDVGLNPETEGRPLITLQSLFGRDICGYSAVALTSYRSSSTLAIGCNSLYILISYLCFTYVYMLFCLC